MRLNANTDMYHDYHFMEREIEESQLDMAYEWYEKLDKDTRETLKKEFEFDPVGTWRKERCDV